MKESNKRTLQRVFLWLGALFILWHTLSFLFSGGSPNPSQSKLEESANLVKTPGDAQRAAAIIDAFRFSWDKYEKYAAPHDTLLPVSKTYEDDRNGWGATAVDGLSTAILMEEAVIVNKILEQIAATDFTVTAVPNQPISLFETTIRYLGGLLSAYDLLSSSHKHLVKNPHDKKNLLKVAVTLADRLSIAFDTPSGIPDDEVIFNPNPRRYGNTDNSITAFGTLVLEWTRLSDLTGNKTYTTLAQRAQDHLIHPKTNQPFTLPGLVGTFVKLRDGWFGDYQAGWGGGSDSYYEYLIKMYAYDPVQFVEYGDSWIQAAESSMKYLASSPSTRPELTFLGELRGSALVPMSSHCELTATVASVCGGSLILGGLLLQNQTFVDFGLKLSESYFETYRQTPAGIAPETFRWIDNGNNPLVEPHANRPPPPKWQSFYEKSGFFHTNPEYILRPETIESLYYAYRATGDKKWQDMAWEAFESLNKMSKVEGGYTGLRSVMKSADDKTREFVDKMESFWLAETLKYLYLMFAEDLDVQVRSDGKMRWVLNTEAHPLLIRGQ
uniref:alpha-1,2-Mannosidase n=1 Tax=Gibberella zeae TaxID=5518 RepID=A0A4E9E3D8_GIBZA